MKKTLAKISRKSDTAGAIRYALSRWRALTRYLDDGRIELDNSAADNSGEWMCEIVPLPPAGYIAALQAGQRGRRNRSAQARTRRATWRLLGLDDFRVPQIETMSLSKIAGLCREFGQ
jgi:hypothetical protein